MSGYGSNRSTNGWLRWPLGVVGAAILVCAIIWGIIWVFSSIFSGAGPILWRDTLGAFHTSLFPGGLPTPLFWMIIAVLASVIFVGYGHHRGSAMLVGVAWTVSVIVVIVALVLCIVKGVTNDIIASHKYLESTTFVVDDTEDLPNMLKKYANNGSLDVPVKEGSLPTSWTPRLASATGAVKVMKKAGDSVNNTTLMDNTITYLYGEGATGEWTAIRNGLNQQYIYGVASWNGSGDQVDSCLFEGDYELNKAFNGSYDKNLSGAVAAAYPSFFYNESDMWGYCDGEEPVIVIPGVTLGHTDMRSIDEAAGVVTIKGSRAGAPVFELLSNVKPGELPGPVYAERLVDSQRGALDWAAGYWQSVNEHFGFDATSVESQAGNNSNYLMKNEGDGRLYWVTPLKAQSTDSETLIGYTLIPADEVTSSVLNAQTVFVLKEGTTDAVNLDDLIGRVKTAVCKIDTNFCGQTATGDIVEFLPVSDTVWQVFAEVGGRVLYRIDVDIDARITPRIVNIESGETPVVEPESGSGAPSAIDCNTPSILSDSQLASCLTSFVDELNSRTNE